MHGKCIQYSYVYYGQPKTVCEYYNGKKHGEEIHYGQISQYGQTIETYRCNYVYGEKHGTEISIFNKQISGQFVAIKQTTDYNMGLKSGKLIQYRDMSTKMYECDYSNDMKNGTEIETISPSIHIKIYKNDKLNGTYIKETNDHKKEYECSYVDDKKDGLEIEYHFEIPTKIIAYKNGKLHGTSLILNNWVKKSEINYFEDKFHGQHITFYDDGKEQCRKTYNMDVLDGKYIEYHKDGIKLLDCNYKNGLKHGPYKSWKPDGFLVRKTNFNNGNED